MEPVQDKPLPLILARNLASNLATPVFIVDAGGTLVFFNEPAERALGRSYAEVGEMARDRWSTIFSPEDGDGSPVPPAELPLIVALDERRAAHRAFYITGLDGARRAISATAFPLFAREDEFVGAVAIFWTEDGAG